MTPKLHHGILLLFLLTFTMYSCSKDTTLLVDTETEIALEEEEKVPETSTEDSPTGETTTEEDQEQEEEEAEEAAEEEEEQEEEVETTGSSCTDPAGFIFNEKNGLVSVEFENADFPGAWKLRSNGNGHSGKGYMVWEGSQYFNDPGTGKVTFKIKIKNPGTYRFLWNTAIKMGNEASEHNDTWLRFDDAADFYGQRKGTTDKVYPKGSGKTPNPAGASKDGWLKIYRSGSNLGFNWDALTNDHSGYEIFVKFNKPGTYLMEVSARSSGHAIDKFVLYNNSWSKSEAISSTGHSVISCN